jgi:hypothetical protein
VPRCANGDRPPPRGSRPPTTSEVVCADDEDIVGNGDVLISAGDQHQSVAGAVADADRNLVGAAEVTLDKDLFGEGIDCTTCLGHDDIVRAPDPVAPTPVDHCGPNGGASVVIPECRQGRVGRFDPGS